MEKQSLCLVDSELTSLDNAMLHSLLLHINAHCNLLRDLSGLERVSGLVSLDVSANQLTSLRGLECLHRLKVLNVSCNNLKSLEELENLLSLCWLDASHNQLSDISSLSRLKRSSQLETLLLHDNRLQSSQHLLQHLSAVGDSLRHLSLWTEPREAGQSTESSVALSSLSSALWSTLPSLVILNGTLSSGEHAAVPQPTVYLHAGEESTGLLQCDSVLMPPISTPRIDEVMGKLAASQRSSDAGTAVSTSEDTAPHHDGMPAQPVVEGTTADSDDSSPAASPVAMRKIAEKKTVARPQQKSRKERAGKQSTATKHTPAQENRRAGATGCKTAPSAVAVTRHVPAKTIKAPTVHKETTPTTTEDMTTSTASNEFHSSQHTGHRTAKPTPSRLAVTGSTTGGLQEEIERRVKAEHAMQRLASTVQRLQGEVNSLKAAGVRWKQQWVDASSQLQAVVKEAEAVRAQLVQEKKLSTQLQTQLTARTGDADREVVSLKERCAELEKRFASELTEEKGEVQRLQLQCTHHQQEAEAMRATVAAQSSQAQFMQTMLGDFVNREQSKLPDELSKLLAQHGTARDEPSKAHEALVSQLQKENEEKRRAYKALEDEFRGALRVEAARYQELQSSAEEQGHKLMQLSDVLSKAETKEKQATAMVSRLTTVLREQQNKVVDLTRQQVEAQSPTEVHTSYERQIASLQATVTALKDEQDRGQKSRQEQDSGLRKERLDLEMQLSRATAQAGSLRLQLHEANEALVIKSKMLDDQNASIKDLKEKLSRAKSDLSEESRSMAGRLQQTEENLMSTSLQNQELQEEVQALEERKQQLKSELATATDQLQEYDSACSALQEEIGKRKAQAIERQECVEQLQRRLADKEEETSKTMTAMDEQTRQHEAAITHLRESLQQQLAQRNNLHKKELLTVKQVHEKLLADADRKVHAIEQDMRVLLSQQEAKQQQVQTVLAQLQGVVLPGPDVPAPGLGDFPAEMGQCSSVGPQQYRATQCPSVYLHQQQQRLAVRPANSMVDSASPAHVPGQPAKAVTAGIQNAHRHIHPNHSSQLLAPPRCTSQLRQNTTGATLTAATSTYRPQLHMNPLEAEIQDKLYHRQQLVQELQGLTAHGNASTTSA